MASLLKQMDTSEPSEAATPSPSFLPRCSPFVGLLPHAPRRLVRTDQLEKLFRRHRSLSQRRAREAPLEEGLQRLESYRGVPYVGFHRHAPPSPLLRFQADPETACLDTCLDFPVFRLEDAHARSARTPFYSRPQGLAVEIWLSIFSYVLDLPTIGVLADLARGFPEMTRMPELWAQYEVHLKPTCIEPLAPFLSVWLPAWRCVRRLLVPQSQQLLTAISLMAPDLKVDVAWRFHSTLRGAGVAIEDHGWAVRRSGTMELVVLGDAPLPTSSEGAYLEVQLDERGEDLADGTNDFGIGVTIASPQEINRLGEVAVEVPQSWVVDFTKTRITLSNNDKEVARGSGAVSSGSLREGSLVGLKITCDGDVEIYLDGVLRERLVPLTDYRVRADRPMFAVLDLWGRSVRISRTLNEKPCAGRAT
mmetsp:Transcript_44391/g.95685  ORF Transcript_44391/g.95685 Transcript_44391/m.95685 type:complete len:420 (-) Transcript_44391:122-1381(-)